MLVHGGGLLRGRHRRSHIRLISNTSTIRATQIWIMASVSNPACRLRFHFGTKRLKFRQTLESDGLLIIRVGPRKPNLNAHAERFVQSCKVECLDHFVCFGVDHLRYIVSRYVSYYNRRRPHQGRNNRTLPVAAGVEPDTIPFPGGPVKCESDLGGLLRHYYRAAA
jgi:hypothetical protein